ncbi:MAG TPA: cupin-like domain-containing protein [Minicystis sp.]|nr:cupin-like domain-containing protein [Minicystis sp.]
MNGYDRAVTGPSLEPILRVRAPSVADFSRRFFVPRRPVVVEGALEGWPALATWSGPALASRFGDRRVSVYEMRKGRVRLSRAAGFVVAPSTVAEVVERVGAGGGDAPFLRAALPGALPELLEDVAPPPYCALGGGLRQNLWYCAAGAITDCHFDLPDNLVACVRGRKRFFVFSPEQGKNLYRRPLASSVPHLAEVDLAAPDTARFPRLARARGVEAVLAPGDLLYLPPRAWHFAEALEETISINFWFARPLSAVLLAASDLYKRVRALRI